MLTDTSNWASSSPNQLLGTQDTGGTPMGANSARLTRPSKPDVEGK